MYSQDEEFNSTGFSFLDRFSESNRWKTIAVFLLFLSALIFYSIILFRIPEMSYGIDGPYYDLQVISILETGVPYHLDNPIVFYYQTFWAIMLGSVVIGIKVGMILLAALVVPISFLFFRQLSNNFMQSWLSSFILAFNPYMLVLLNGHYKNLASLPFMFAFFYFYIQAIRSGKRRDVFLGFVFLCLTFLTHIFASGLIVICVGFHWLYITLSERRFWTDTTKLLLKYSLSLFSVLIVVLIIYPDGLAKFAKVFSFTSSLSEQTTRPFSFQPWIMYLTRLDIPVFILIPGLIAIAHNLLKKKSDHALSIILALGIAELILSSPMIPNEWSVRFSFLFFVPLGFVIPYLIWRFKFSKNQKTQTVVLSVIVLIVGGFFFVSTYQSVFSHHPQAIGPFIPPEGYRDLMYISEHNVIPEDAIVFIGSNGFHYWVMLVTGIETFYTLDDAFDAAREASTLLYWIDTPTLRDPPPFASNVYSGTFFSVYTIMPPP